LIDETMLGCWNQGRENFVRSYVHTLGRSFVAVLMSALCISFDEFRMFNEYADKTENHSCIGTIRLSQSRLKPLKS
jgi:hypothetical protein